MKTKIEFEVDFYEDQDFINNIFKANDYLCIINEAYGYIRHRLKHSNEPISESEAQFLEELKEMLFIDD